MKILIPAIFSLFSLVASDTFAQKSDHLNETHPHKHSQYAKAKNPVPVTEQSLKRGAELYENHCIGCHGKRGAAAGNLSLTKPIFIHGGSDGEIFHVITNGVKGTRMAGFKKETTDEDRWQLVNYIKSLMAIPEVPGKQIRETSLKGYTLTYNLLEMSERDEMLKVTGRHSVIGMVKGPDVTNHLMVYIQRPDGKIAFGDVAFMLISPDGKESRTMTKGMLGGYGADVVMKLKGVYTIRTKIIIGDRDAVTLDDVFTVNK